MSIFASLKGLEFVAVRPNSEVGGEENRSIQAVDDVLTRLVRRASFDRYHFFLPHDLARYAEREVVPNRFPDLSGRIGVFGTASIPQHIEADPWDLLYADLVSGAYLRDTFSQRAFPIVWRIEELDSTHVEERAVELLLSNLGPHDAIVHASMDQRRALEDALEDARSLVGRVAGHRMDFPARFFHLPLSAPPDLERAAVPSGYRSAHGLCGRPIVLLAGGFEVWRADLLFPLLNLWRSLPSAADPDRSACLVIHAPQPAAEPSRALVEIVDALGMRGSVFFEHALPLGQLLLEADVFLCAPERSSPRIGRLLSQAQCRGIPVVVPDLPEYSEHILAGKTGLLIPARTGASGGPEGSMPCGQIWDASALRESLVQLLGRSEVRHEMGCAGRKRADGEWHPDGLAKRLDDLCGELQELCRAAPVELRRSARPGLTALNCGFFDSFRWNFTEILDDGSRLERSPLGDLAVHGRHAPPLYAKLAPYVRPERVSAILAATGSGTTLERLCPAKEDVEETLFHVLWMMKHGLIVGRGRPATLVGTGRRIR